MWKNDILCAHIYGQMNVYLWYLYPNFITFLSMCEDPICTLITHKETDNSLRDSSRRSARVNECQEFMSNVIGPVMGGMQ